MAAFTAALLNNQPMDFYHPSTIIKDAQRHDSMVRLAEVGALNTLERAHRRDAQELFTPGRQQVRMEARAGFESILLDAWSAGAAVS
jgi:DNA polymerase III alpha subunit